MSKNKPGQPSITTSTADTVEIIYFTDPLCCWSWAFEPIWKKLISEFANHVSYQYVMCGLLPDWKSYHDPINSVSRPAQMGPVWMQASHISGVPIKSELWITDPPVSSYPSCIAVKCADIQSHPFGEQYLQLAREAVMLQLQNISQQEVLVTIAEKLAKTNPGFDLQRFEDDLVNGIGLEAFRADWNRAQMQRIDRYPTLVFKRKSHRSILFSGYKPYESLLQAFQQIAPDLVGTESLS